DREALRAIARDLRVLRRERAFGLEAVRDLAGREVERLLRAHETVLVEIGLVARQRGRPVLGETRRVALVAAAGRRDDRAAVGRPALEDGAARARAVHDELSARRHAREKLAERLAADVRARQIQLVVVAVERAVPDQ